MLKLLYTCCTIKNSNITASFADRLKFQEKVALQVHFGRVVPNHNKISRIMTL